MFQLNNLKPAAGGRKHGKRKGRGYGSGNGTYGGRGQNGQKSRSGGKMGAWFEGGQMPVYRRIPKRGFTPPNRIENTVINLSEFERFDASREITVEYLRELGMVRGAEPRVKILGFGEVSAAYRLRVHGVSGAAKAKIEAQGGSVELVPYGTAPKAAAGKQE